MSADLLLVDVNLATMQDDAPGYGENRGAAVAISGGEISWIGDPADAPDADATVPLEGRWATPGLIDCHTHLLFGGNRAGEFEARLGGATYEEIAAAGGGILSTVAATRAASDDELLASASRRAGWLARSGATTIEVKSGYGLDTATELRMLELIGRIGSKVPVSVVSTFLGAHTVPAEFRSDRAGYVDLVCNEMIPLVAERSLATAVDVFCDSVGFSLAETQQLFDAAAAHGLHIKVHAGQLSDLGGAADAARRGALSADHLEHLGVDGIAAMAEAGTVAVVLPGASYVLDEAARPPIDALREAGVPIALSTDLNPGTSPVATLPLACSFGANRFGLTPVECLRGVTANAARALGLEDRGVIAVGKRADLAIWDIDGPEELSYWVGGELCHATITNGRPRFWQPPQREGT